MKIPSKLNYVKRGGKTDIILINPPGDFSARERLPHYGIGYLASSLEKEEIQAEIIDADYERLSLNDTLKKIKKFDPLAIGIYSSSSQLPKAVFLASEIKNFSKAKIILGGPHVSFAPEILDHFHCFDYGLRGEGEISLPILVKKIKSGTGGLSRIINGEYPQDLDKLPFPRYSAFSMEKGRVPLFKPPASYVFISRGCPFNCTFCSVSFNPVRFRSAQNIIEEIMFLKNTYGINSFFFQCGTFTLNRNQIISLCEEMTKANINCQWGASTRCDLIDEPLIKKMKETGCVNLNFGIESGSPRIRKMMNKDFSDQQVLFSYEICRKYKIKTAYYWLFGYPTETKEDFQKTLDLSLKIGDYASFAPVLVFPGTELYRIARQEEKITEHSWSDFARTKRGIPIYLPDKMTAKDIVNYVKKAYLRFYLRKRQIFYLRGKLNPYYLKIYLGYFRNFRNVY